MTNAVNAEKEENRKEQNSIGRLAFSFSQVHRNHCNDIYGISVTFFTVSIEAAGYGWQQIR